MVLVQDLAVGLELVTAMVLIRAVELAQGLEGLTLNQALGLVVELVQVQVREVDLAQSPTEKEVMCLSQPKTMQ